MMMILTGKQDRQEQQGTGRQAGGREGGQEQVGDRGRSADWGKVFFGRSATGDRPGRKPQPGSCPRRYTHWVNTLSTNKIFLE
jgi:hypothetical protein